MNSKRNTAIFFAILAAMLFGISAPASKALLVKIPPTLMASFLYLGAGIGMLMISMVQRLKNKTPLEASLTKKELPYILGMIFLDIAAPIFLMIGLTMTTASNASLLNNFEIVATSLIALFIFKESIDRRLWTALGLITTASIILSIEDMSSFSFSLGSIFVLLACISWGLENNCTRMLSIKNPMDVVIIKGFGSGIGALIIALILRERANSIPYVLAALLLGFFAYGLSIFFYVSAQRVLGAARTSAYYAIAPFIGVGISLLVFKESPTLSFMVALGIMILGAYYASTEDHVHEHVHPPLAHDHRHSHDDGHHDHSHDEVVVGEHSHPHSHGELAHSHGHTPDIHHSHGH